MWRKARNVHSIHASIHYLDDLIQNHKRSLQTRKFNKRLHSPRIRLPTPRDLLSALAQTRELEITRYGFVLVGFELGEEDSGDVFLFGSHSMRASILVRMVERGKRTEEEGNAGGRRYLNLACFTDSVIW